MTPGIRTGKPLTPKATLLIALGFGGMLIVWSIVSMCFGNFHVGVEKKGRFVVTPVTAPIGFWVTTCMVAALGAAVIVAAVCYVLRTSTQSTVGN
jgi:hypothetical protein